MITGGSAFEMSTPGCIVPLPITESDVSHSRPKSETSDSQPLASTPDPRHEWLASLNAGIFDSPKWARYLRQFEPPDGSSGFLALVTARAAFDGTLVVTPASISGNISHPHAVRHPHNEAEGAPS